MNRILITGVNGFIGSTLIKKIENQDVKLFGIDNLKTY